MSADSGRKPIVWGDINLGVSYVLIGSHLVKLYLRLDLLVLVIVLLLYNAITYFKEL